MRTYFIACCLFIALLIYHNDPPRVTSGIAFLASQEVKQAMKKMGPGKNYRMLPDGRLQVLVEGKWLRLRY